MTTLPAEEPATLRDYLAGIWAEVFAVTGSFDDDQSFFEVGGTSIMAVRLRARILDEFGVDIELADIFAGGSVAELVSCIEAGLTAEPVPVPGDGVGQSPAGGH